MGNTSGHLGGGGTAETSFPGSLGPFAIVRTTLQEGDFEFTQNPSEEEQSVWLVHEQSVVGHGIRCGANARFPLMGQFSPVHSITLGAREKIALGIPAAASSFVWSYPVSGWTCLSASQSKPISKFFSVGGYVYFDSAGKMLRCNTLQYDPESAGDGLQFAEPQAWKGEWTASLVRQGRFQPITIKSLHDAGARYFCWLRPGEIAGSCREQPDVPHGGFVYLFHDDPADHSSSDCYFAIASGENYKHKDLALEANKSCSQTPWTFANLTQHTMKLISASPPGKEKNNMSASPPQIIVGQNNSPFDNFDVPVLVRIDAFPSLGQRRPADICCIIDISGSMGTEAKIQDASGHKESHGLSLLDVAKHAVRTVIHSVSSQDRLSIVCFDDDAKVVLPLTFMRNDAQKDAENKLSDLRVCGGTNIWAGLEKGLESLGSSSLFQSRQNRMQHVLLLTDGQDGSSGVPAHTKLQQHLSKQSPPLTVSTFGFGYGIDSKLLIQLAKIGGGSYAFIPDAGFVGTVFVNAISNMLVTMTSSAYLELQPAPGMKIARIAGIDADAVENRLGSTHVKIGVLQIGQARDVVVHMTATSQYVAGKPYLTAQLRFNLPGAQCTTVQAFPVDAPDMLEVERQVHRCDVVDTLGKIWQEGVGTRTQSLQVIQQLGDRIRSSTSVSDSFVASLLEDVQGEVIAALSDDKSLSLWGVHYLPSLMFAHKLQQCNNFKDPGVQMYGGNIFNELRDFADDTFNELPPPKPSITRGRPSGSVALVNMSAYNNSYGG